MYLKRLQTVGFKSFAERIDIQFNRGVTAVVGPNGSGKSNIIDAVRWVLGEQSARSLRGQKMEDIIFQGSDTRNAMNFAEVTLTLDNASETLPLDYEEVSVTRRVYRSGESEFFINKQACRLKDIIDLFIDSGLGREAFSIISQGKVEEILSSKADDRRVIFEEAAGVLKYKQRKQEAEFKLNETEENLNRVEDIIYEVEQQIEPLKNQANKAHQYNELKDQLKQIEIRLLVTEIGKLHDEWKASLKSVEQKRLTEIEMKTKIQEREAKLTEARLRLQELDEDINNLQNNLLEATELLEKFEGERNVLDERLKHFVENKNKLKEEKETIENTIIQIETELENEIANLKTLHTRKEYTVQKMNELTEKLRYEEENLQTKIEDLKSDYIELLNNRAVTQNEKQTIKHDIKKLEDRHLEYQDDHSDVISKRKRVKDDTQLLKSKLDDVMHNIHVSEEKEINLKNNLRSLINNLDNMTKNRYKEIEQMTKLTSRKETLEEMKESYQGYFYGVKALLKQNKDNRQFDIHGTVFDLIDVPHTYVTAIDTILGAQAQHIVVQTEKDAREAIYWLKQENKGRATFLPINAISDRSLPNHILQKISNEKGFVGVAANLINIDQSFQIVANHLLGNVIVTTTLQAANTIARMTNRSYRIVTLDGDVVYPGGSMSGGARRQTNQSLFTREKDLQLIKKTIDERNERIHHLTMKMDDMKQNINKIEHDIENNTLIIVDNKKQLDSMKLSYDEKKMELLSLDNELKSYNLSVQHDEEEKRQLKKRYKKLDQLLAHLEQELHHTQTKINELTTKEENLRYEEEQTQQQLHKLEISLAEQEERIKNEEEKINELQKQQNQFKQEQHQIDDQIADLKQIEKSKEQKLMTERKIEEQLNVRDITKQTLTEQREKRVKLNEWIEDEQRDLKEEHKQHGQLMSIIQNEEVQANRLDVALDTRLAQLEKQYVTTYEKASKQYGIVTHVNEATERVNKLKYAINRLGTVNLGAIEEYERIVERFNFLTEQQQDLLEAKETLYSIIKEMDEEMIKRFSTTFSHIQTAFTEVFKELFGGGHAKLTLTDETNLLETGIEIVARPPGKKLRTLDLLSGGEKALTAISLLFAILRVRPVPFVILDEVEAALDEANIVRFAKYLKMYSDDTQFIVITHRKGTMEEADVLYGVTMQESGVSRLVSVRLEETEQLVSAN